MKSKEIRVPILILFFVFALILIVGCSSEDEKDDYSVVSQMIADRNKARFQKAQQKASGSNSLENELSPDDAVQNNKTETESSKSAGMTFEEEVLIVSESSGKTLSRGTAYLDKSGKIMKIIIKN